MVPFVGREEERARLLAGWKRARAGELHHVLLSGEAGIGKSRLAEELVAQARSEGGRVLRGRCWDVGGAPAYWPWTQAFGSHLEEVGPAAFAPLLADLDPGLARLFPRLQSALRAPTEYDVGGSEATQLRLFDGVTVLLRRLSADRPVLLLLDDLESADGPSLELLRFLVRARAGGGLMTLAVYRAPLPGGSPAAVPLWGIGREPAVEMMTLGGLAVPDIAALMTAVAGSGQAASLAAALHARTGGNPLFATEFIRLLAAPGTDGGALLASALPSGVRGIIGQRLATLPSECRLLLTVAAVLGREFDAGTLSAVVARPPEEVLADLAPAQEVGVLLAAPARAPSASYLFAHPLLRESLYQDLSPAPRAELHLAVADSLCRRFAGDLDEHLATVASHYVAAAGLGGAEKAVEFCRRAAGRASRLAARDEAVRLLELGLQAVTSLDDQRLACDLLLELGEAQARAGRMDDARATALRVSERAQRLGLPTHMARAALAFGGRFVWARTRHGSPELGLLETALAALPETELSLRARLMSRLSGLDRNRRTALASAARSRQAVQLARESGDRDVLTGALTALTLTELAVGTGEGVLACTDELLSVAASTGNLEAELQAHDYRLIAHLERGETVLAEQELGICREMAERLAQPPQLWFTRLLSALVALARGQLARAEVLAEEARLLGEKVQPIESRFCFLNQLHHLRREQGRGAELPGPLSEAVAALPLIKLLRCLHLLAEVASGRHHEARAFLDRQLDTDWADIQDSVQYRYLLALCAEMAAATKHASAGRALAPLLAELPQRHLVSAPSVSAGSVFRYRALAAWAAGEAESAARWLQDAARENRAAGALVWALRCELERSRLLLEQDGPDLGGVRSSLWHIRTEATAAELPQLAEESARLLATITADKPDSAGEIQGDIRDVAAAPGRTSPPGPTAPELAAEFRREGEFWTIGWSGRSLRLRDAKGLRYLGQLLSQAGRELPAMELVVGAGEAPLPVEAEAAPVLDGEARLAFKRRLERLEVERGEAEAWNDMERLRGIDRERALLAEELAGAVGLGGRDRRLGDTAERARQSVTKAIKGAIRRIAREDRELGRHLDSTVHTGLFCRYEPDPLRPPPWLIRL